MMKCYVHPNEDAVAICKNCGKGVCSDCAIEIRGTAYCKTCVESNLVPTTPRVIQTAMTPSGGILSLTHSMMGVVGGIMAGLAALMFIFTGGLVLLWWRSNPLDMNLVSLADFVILGAGLLIAGIGYFGISRSFKKAVATVSFAFSIVVTAFLLVTAGFGLITSINYNYYYYYGASWWMWTYIITLIVSLVLFGVMQILWGVSHIQTRQYARSSGLSLATGIVFIVSGALTASFLVSFVGIILFFIANIMAAISFILMKMPPALS
jgi:hypothetical protein